MGSLSSKDTIESAQLGLCYFDTDQFLICPISFPQIYGSTIHNEYSSGTVLMQLHMAYFIIDCPETNWYYMGYYPMPLVHCVYFVDI